MPTPCDSTDCSLGRGLFTQVDIPQDSIILVEKPIVETTGPSSTISMNMSEDGKTYDNEAGTEIR